MLRAAKECKKIITVEEHSTIGGLGEAVCSLLAEKCPTPVRRLGVPDSYGHSGPGVGGSQGFRSPCRRRRRGHSGVRQGKGGITPKRQRAHSVYKNRHPPRAGACFALRVRFFVLRLSAYGWSSSPCSAISALISGIVRPAARKALRVAMRVMLGSRR